MVSPWQSVRTTTPYWSCSTADVMTNESHRFGIDWINSYRSGHEISRELWDKTNLMMPCGFFSLHWASSSNEAIVRLLFRRWWVSFLQCGCVRNKMMTTYQWRIAIMFWYRLWVLFLSHSMLYHERLFEELIRIVKQSPDLVSTTHYRQACYRLGQFSMIASTGNGV